MNLYTQLHQMIPWCVQSMRKTMDYWIQMDAISFVTKKVPHVLHLANTLISPFVIWAHVWVKTQDKQDHISIGERRSSRD
jgi:hypothetical protein